MCVNDLFSVRIKFSVKVVLRSIALLNGKVTMVREPRDIMEEDFN